MGRSVTGGGDNGAVTEVATTFPARCLGPLELDESSERFEMKKMKRGFFFPLKSLENFKILWEMMTLRE